MEASLANVTYLGLVLVLLGTGLDLPIPAGVPLLLAGYLGYRWLYAPHEANKPDPPDFPTPPTPDAPNQPASLQ